MNVHFQIATVSYSPDLTGVDAASIPVAVLAVGRGESGDWFGASIGIGAKPLTAGPLAQVFNLDPLAARMLGDVPGLIRRYVDRAMAHQTADATPKSVLETFSSVLRTSIHVSAISDSQCETFARRDQIPSLLAARALQQLTDALMAFAPSLEDSRRTEAKKAPKSLDIMNHVEQVTWHPPSPPSTQLHL